MGTRRRALAACAVAGLVAAAAGACLPGAGPPLNPVVDDAGSPPPTNLGDDGPAAGDINLGPPFAVTGLQPSHGPWTGGTRTNIAGRGFSSNLQVWIGGNQLSAGDVFASDPTKVAVVTPQGTPGPAVVRVRNVTTAADATLQAGFFYDAFSVTPGGGATTGGTRIALYGSGTHWTAASTVNVGSNACTAVGFTDATHIACTTPASSAGSQSVTVKNADGSIDQADDAFVYSDSPDGYRGGLYGGALAGTLHVLAFDAWTGVPLVGGTAIAGSNLATAVVGTLGASGAVQLSGPSLQGAVTVTVDAHCHQPWTYVDVPVDTVTVYLNPTLDPSCAGDPSSGGNFVPQDYGQVSGELVWSGGIEFQRAPWANVPQPGPGERQAAYVFVATSDAMHALSVPDPSAATTPDSGGQVGYAYTLSTVPGNQTIYALAGLETLPDAGGRIRFEPWAMGVVRGVPVLPNVVTAGVAIPMTSVLDRTVTSLPKPPAPTSRGPDRLLSTIALDLGAGRYAQLPQGASTSLLPVPGKVAFAGVPALDGTLVGASYDLTAQAVSGPYQGAPQSVVTGIETTDADNPVTVGGFFDIPKLLQPSIATWSGTHVQIQASGPIDLAVVDVTSGSGLVNWRIVAPGSDLSFDLPDIAQIPNVGHMAHGPLSTTFSIARMNGFQYGLLRTGQLSTSAWSAYAQDVAQGTY